MNSALFLQHFDRLSEAPDAIPQLRQFILDLAVRGKLIEQDASEAPASDMLGGRILSLTASESPWQLPTGWSWSSLALLGESLGGGTPSKENSEFWNGQIPWVSPKDMKIDFISDSEDHISEDAIAQSAVRLIPVGALLIVVRGMILAHSFPTAIATGQVTINQDMKAVVPFRADMGRMLLLLMKGLKPIVLRLVRRSTHGTCKLLTGDLFALPIPIPPLPEQDRIVAKVDELMSLCDQLEAAHAERERRRDRLTAASLNRINQPSVDMPAFREHSRFQLDHLPRIIMHRSHVRELRETILRLAVRGQLVPQNPNDEPAWELLKQIQEAKGGLINDGLVKDARKKARTPPSIEMREEPSRIPDSWKWVRTELICEVIVDCPHSTPVFVPSGIVCLDTNCFKAGSLIPTRIRYVSEASYRERVQRLVPRAGDVVFAREGSVGASVIVPEGMKCCLGQRVMLFRLMPGVLSTYFGLAISEPSSLMRLLALHKGIGAKHINVADMRGALIPLPPLAEQRRIVAKVGELMAVCDQLEAQLTTTQTASRRLLQAVLHEALVSVA